MVMTQSLPKRQHRVNQWLGRGMLFAPNKLALFFAKKFLDNISFSSQDIARISELSKAGSIVYVHRSTNVIWHWALTRSLKANGLPLAYFTAGCPQGILKRWFGLAELFMRRWSGHRRATDEETLFKSCVREGHAAELSLYATQRSQSEKSNSKDSAKLIVGLIKLQRTQEKPIFLLPQLLALKTRPGHFEPTAADRIFGSASEPGTLRSLLRILLSYKSARFEVGTEINLKTFIGEKKDSSDNEIARSIKWKLLRQMMRMEQTLHGPPMKSHARIRSDTLKDGGLQSYLTQLSQETGIEKRRLQKKAASIFEALAARFDIDALRLLDHFFRLIWHRIYDGIYWDNNDIDKIRMAARRGPLVFIPSHKSHVDYLIVSQVLHWNGLLPPHIAAGANLSFFPLGPFLRRCGAYFIRRSFKGDKLYPQVVKAYLRRLFKEGFSQEFFIEGGRSRSGKLLAPKLGLLGLMIDGLLAQKPMNAVFVPTSISYDKVVEQEDYHHELLGGEKQSESAAGLIRSAGVLRQRYGRAFISFDEPIDLMEFLAINRLSTDDSPDARLQITKALAIKIALGINHASIVTTNALVVTALFGAPRRTLSMPILKRAIRRMVAFMRAAHGPHLRLALGDEAIKDQSIENALGRLVLDRHVHQEQVGKIVYFRMKENAALLLEFYKNSVIHHFVPSAFAASAFLAQSNPDKKSAPKDMLIADALLLREILALEFIYSSEDARQTMDKNLAFLAGQGIFEIENETVYITERPSSLPAIEFASRLLAPLVATYLVVFRKLAKSAEKKPTEKVLINKLMEELRSSYLSGAIDTPESRNKVTVTNCIHLCKKFGYLHLEDDRIVISNIAKNDMQKLIQALERFHVKSPTTLSGQDTE
jgi:glycerol-3-phosphate O-acyltransferase